MAESDKTNACMTVKLDKGTWQGINKARRALVSAPSKLLQLSTNDVRFVQNQYMNLHMTFLFFGDTLHKMAPENLHAVHAMVVHAVQRNASEAAAARLVFRGFKLYSGNLVAVQFEATEPLVKLRSDVLNALKRKSRCFPRNFLRLARFGKWDPHVTMGRISGALPEDLKRCNCDSQELLELSLRRPAIPLGLTMGNPPGQAECDWDGPLLFVPSMHSTDTFASRVVPSMYSTDTFASRVSSGSISHPMRRNPRSRTTQDWANATMLIQIQSKADETHGKAVPAVTSWTGGSGAEGAAQGHHPTPTWQSHHLEGSGSSVASRPVHQVLGGMEEAPVGRRVGYQRSNSLEGSGLASHGAPANTPSPRLGNSTGQRTLKIAAEAVLKGAERQGSQSPADQRHWGGSQRSADGAES